MKNLENNKLIAEFMGFKYYPPVKWYDFSPRLSDRYSLDGKTGYRLSDFMYNESWNLLMQVVEKIRRWCYDKYKCSDKMGDIFRGIHMVDINLTYNAVIEFINWYNAQKA